MVRSSVIAVSIATAASQKAGTLTQENHPRLSFSECTSSGSCSSKQGAVTIDSNWRWTHKNGEPTDCYHGNKWDSSICPDSKTCTSNCVVEGADTEYTSTYGVKASGSDLELGFVTQGPYSKNVGSRTYLLEGDKYKLFQLKNKEFTYTVDDSKLGCGLNGALYFVAMDEDGGASKYGHAGAKYGLGYCDAQCPHDLKWQNGEANVDGWVSSDTDENAGRGVYGSCCTEIDIWEANSISTAFTMHACSVDEQTRCEGDDCGDSGTPKFDVGGAERFKGVCDKNGCDMQSYRLGTTDFWGPGSNFKIDSTKPVTVTTQFITDDGTDSGKLSQVKQLYTQNGQVIEHQMYNVNGNQHDTISDDFCKDWAAYTEDGTNFLEKGGLGSVEKAIEKGVVLVMSLWDDHDVNMLWLDSTYPTDGQQKGSHRGTCSTDSGVPAFVEEHYGDSSVKFSDIKYGPIGSTVGPVPAPTPTPTPPAPSPSPSGCPGGSLSACIDLCPPDIFAACAESCSKRCPHAALV